MAAGVVEAGVATAASGTQQLFHSKIVDGYAAQNEFTSLKHDEALPKEKSPSRFARFDIEASDPAILGRRFQMVVKGRSDARSSDIRATVKMIDVTVLLEIAIGERPIGIIRRHQQDPTIGSPFEKPFRVWHDRRPCIQLLERVMKPPDLMNGGVENPCERGSVPWPK